MELPNLFSFTELISSLRAWAESFPDGLSNSRVASLGAAAGVSREHMWNVLNGRGKLTPHAVPGLCRLLGHEGAAATYFAQLVDLHRARSGRSQRALRAVWQTYSAHHGLDWEEVAGALSSPEPPEITSAALVCALQALGVEAPTPTGFSRAAVVPVTAAQVAEAAARLAEAPEGVATKLAPGLVALPDPRRDEAAAAAWAGTLGWIRDSTLRTPIGQRGTHFWACSVDSVALVEIMEARRHLKRRLERLAVAYAHAHAEHLFVVAVPQITLTEVWQTPNKLRRIETRAEGLPLAGQTITMDELMVKRSTSTSSPILGCLTLPEAMRAWRATQHRDRRSDAFLARRMGCKRSYVNDLASGRTRFKEQHVADVARAFDVEGDETMMAWLSGMARLGEPLSQAERVAVLEVLRGIAADHGITMLAIEEMLANRWYVAATFALSFLPNFRAIPAWVSRALRGRITWRAATEALKTLARLGLLPDAQGRHAKITVEARECEFESVALLQHEEVLRLCRAELDMLTEGSLYPGWMLALPSVAVSRLLDSVKRFVSDVTTTIQSADARVEAGSPPDRVVLITAYCAPVLNHLARRPLRA